MDKIGKNTRSRGRPVASFKGTSKTKLPSAKTAAYSLLRANGIPTNLAKSALDIPDSTNMSTGTIEQQREKALKALNLTIHSQLKTLVDIRDDADKTPCSDRINAVKTINTMVPGFVAPAEIKVNHTAVMMEFTSLSSQDLAQLADILHVNTSVSNQCTDVTDSVQVVDSNGDNVE